MGVYKRGRIYYIDYYYQGRRIRERVGPNKKLASQALDARKGSIVQDRYDLKRPRTEIRFSVFTKKYLEYSRANKKSYKRDEVSIKALMPYFGDKLLSEITSWLIEKYKVSRREVVKPATVNRELACLKHIFSKAIEWGKASDNPVKKVKLFREDNRRLRFLSDEECRDLIASSAEHLRPIIITALNTGMRLGEILGLKWKDINFNQGIITVEKTKNDESRKIQVNDLLIETLRDLRKISNSEYVFCDKEGRPYTTVKTAFKTALEKAGIKDCVFHTLRHTFASNLVMRGVDIVTVKELLGHKTIDMTMRYSHLSSEHKKRAVKLLEKIG